MPNSAAALAWVRWCSLIRSLTRSASCTRSLRSPASANPRSTNTSPVPAETVSRFLVLLTIAHLIVGSRQLQALANQFDIFPGRTNSRGGFFLKAMQHVHRLRKLHGVGRAERALATVLDNFEDARTFALPRLG